MKKGIAIVFMILSILLILMSLLLLIVAPVGGIIGLAFGVIILIFAIRSLKKKGPVYSEPAATAPTSNDRSLFLSVAGVTFKNDDGSSRQTILKQIAESVSFTDSTAYLERYVYEGEDAIRVSTVLGTVGNIRRSDIKKVLPIIEGGYLARIYPETFEDENDKLIYRADVNITPLK